MPGYENRNKSVIDSFILFAYQTVVLVVSYAVWAGEVIYYCAHMFCPFKLLFRATSNFLEFLVREFRELFVLCVVCCFHIAKNNGLSARQKYER